ncbi:MAG: peptidoglycan-binding domain-containing protein [Dermatophilus congolensis]|nr:peptidoglycan-binding domain-containing protein [Dermatophilus congolensis]
MLAHIGRSLFAATSLASVVALGATVAAPASVAAPSAASRGQSAPRWDAPISRVTLPTQVDAQPGYQPQNSCDPVSREGTTALGNLLAETYGGGAIGYSRFCVRGTTEHSDGRALDWMLDANDANDLAVAEQALDWMLADNGAVAKRLGIQYVIWNKQIWRAYRGSAGWQPYRGASPHTDHIHISLTWDGAMKRTSWWTGKAVTSPDRGTCRVYTGEFAPVYAGINRDGCGATAAAPVSGKPTYVVGQVADDIKIAQEKLGVDNDGEFGPITRRALFDYQQQRGLPRTGVLDQASWVSLLAG